MSDPVAFSIYDPWRLFETLDFDPPTKGDMTERVESVTMEHDVREAAGRAVPATWLRYPSANVWRDALLRRMLAVADVAAALIASLSLAVALGHELGQLMWALAWLPLWIVFAKLLDLYDRDQRSLRHLTVDEIPQLVLWAVCGTLALAVVLELMPAKSLALANGVKVAAIAALAALLLRSSARSIWRHITPRERAVIVGVGPAAEAVRRKIELFPDTHINVVAQEPDIGALLRGPRGRLAGIDRVVVATPSLDETLIRSLVSFGRSDQVKVSVVPPARGLFGTAVQLNHVADLPVLEYSTWDVSRSTLLVKRILDLVVSSLALVLLAPVFLVIALAIRLDSRGWVVFAQQRAGLGGRPFRIHKFRTMVRDAEARLPELVRIDALSEPMFKLEDDPRVTRVGRYLRRWSLDELPQLFDVLRGDMSLVGPRPEQIELVERYRPEHLAGLSVKPGLTGPMQVYGRARLTFHERMSVERDYVENLSLFRDLRLLALTVTAVIRRKGAF
jgi:exopolysaccharide biosynthesis polyprenyl glycosylphosphotransferase